MTAQTRIRDAKLYQVAKKCFQTSKLNTIDRMTGGVSADVYCLNLTQSDGSKNRLVLRCHGETHSGHSAQLEFELLEALFRAGLSVPEPLCFDTSCALLKHPFIVIKFVEGSSHIEQSQLEPCIEKMASELSLVHGIDIEIMPELPQRVNPVPELLEFLPQGAEWRVFRDYLTGLKNTSYVGPRMLLHGDFWTSNLIWSNGQIAAILDWEDAAVGDPLSDVACACLELRYIYGETGQTCSKQHTPGTTHSTKTV